MASFSPKIFSLYAVLAVIVIFVFSPCLQAGFINIDDPAHLLENPAVSTLSFHSLKAVFTQTINNVYIPLTILSFAIERHFFGLNAFIFHLDNLLLHVTNVILVLLLARRMGLSCTAAFLAALIFGIHPMKVESVAWVTERKDVLYALFYLLALHQYQSYLKSKAIGAYLGAFFCGFISMLAKPMALSLPLVLLLFDWFQGRRWDRNILIEKIPFFFYVVEIGSLSYIFNLRNPVADLGQAFLIWIWSFNFYIYKFLWPAHVSFIYFLPHPIVFSWPYIASIGVFILTIGLLVRYRKYRFLIFALGYYFVSIFFLLRFDEKVDFTVVSDRFMYLPCLGLCMAIGLGLERVWKHQKLIMPFILVLIIFWGGITFKQCHVWRTSISFWEQIVRENPNNCASYFYRGSTYLKSGQDDLALADFSKAIELNPLFVNAYYNRGFVYFSRHDYKKAIENMNRAIQLDPRDYNAYVLRAAIEEKDKEFSMAAQDIQQAQQITGVSFSDALERLKKESP
jgi:tetratricopeptide (TPR) repeat protein